MVLGDIQGNIKPSDIELYGLPLWVRVYNLPFKGRLNPNNIQAVGKKIGAIINVDQSGSRGIDKSIRIRIMVDIRKPLRKHVTLKLRGGVEENFEVKYEKLPLYCFFCGMIGHGTKDCDDCKDIDSPVRNYGPDLKASPWKVFRDDNHGEKGEEAPLSCAKKLFTTKPKSETHGKVCQHVNEVISKMKRVELEEEGTDMIKGVEDLNNAAKGNDSEKDVNKGIFNDIGSNDSSGEVESSDVGEISKLVKQKKWCRVARKEKGVKGISVGCTGKKRASRDTWENYEEAMEIESLHTSKKIGVDLSLVLGGDELQANPIVAGPT